MARLLCQINQINHQLHTLHTRSPNTTCVFGQSEQVSVRLLFQIPSLSLGETKWTGNKDPDKGLDGCFRFSPISPVN